MQESTKEKSRQDLEEADVADVERSRQESGRSPGELNLAREASGFMSMPDLHEANPLLCPVPDKDGRCRGREIS